MENTMKRLRRREFLGWMGCGALGLAGLGAAGARSAGGAAPGRGRLNFLLITADDMNYSSPGVFGCRIPGITPNIDRLASEGVRFLHAHVSAAICQPSRQAMMTGRYPHCNSAGGFNPIRDDVPTLQEQLHAAGYMLGILGKVPHLAPQGRFCWDTAWDQKDLGMGRDPNIYYQRTKTFFADAKAAGKPFFLMANSHDPHRPFAGSETEKGGGKKGGAYPPASKYYKPEEVVIPGFLPDIPDVRREVAQYFTSVHRCDETVGAVLRALKEAGLEDSTLVMFLSDNGMSFPFAKTNCYLTSTRTPWIVRWPGKVKPGATDEPHFISGIDFMPTILEAAGLPAVAGMNGRSFLPVLLGGEQPGRDLVFTEINTISSGASYPMRCVQGARFGYIFSAWSDGKRVFKNESQSGLSFKAMVAAAEKDTAIAERVKFFQCRTPEEFYDFQEDPDALHNLIGDPRYKDEIAKMRKALMDNMAATADPVLPAFKQHLGSAAGRP
jgi:N-sulfoglucosamine sulfohydrolase